MGNKIHNRLLSRNAFQSLSGVNMRLSVLLKSIIFHLLLCFRTKCPSLCFPRQNIWACEYWIGKLILCGVPIPYEQFHLPEKVLGFGLYKPGITDHIYHIGNSWMENCGRNSSNLNDFHIIFSGCQNIPTIMLYLANLSTHPSICYYAVIGKTSTNEIVLITFFMFKMYIYAMQ